MVQASEISATAKKTIFGMMVALLAIRENPVHVKFDSIAAKLNPQHILFLISYWFAHV